MGENVVRQVPGAEDQLLGLVIAGQLQGGAGTVRLKTGSPGIPPHLDTQVRVRCRLPTPPQDSGHLPKVPGAHCCGL